MRFKYIIIGMIFSLVSILVLIPMDAHAASIKYYGEEDDPNGTDFQNVINAGGKYVYFHLVDNRYGLADNGNPKKLIDWWCYLMIDTSCQQVVAYFNHYADKNYGPIIFRVYDMNGNYINFTNTFRFGSGFQYDANGEYVDNGTICSNVGTQLGFSDLYECNIPVFSTSEQCDNYIATGSLEGALSVPKSMQVKEPYLVDVYADSSNNNIINFRFMYEEDYDYLYNATYQVYIKDGNATNDYGKYSAIQAQEVTTDNIFSIDMTEWFSLIEINENNSISTDVNIYIYSSDGSLLPYNHRIALNYTYDTIRDEPVLEWVDHNYLEQLKKENYGIADPKQLIDATHRVEVKNPGSSGGGYDSGFSGVGNISDGFGVLDGSLMDMLADTFKFLPSDIWNIIASGLIVLVLVACIKHFVS